MSVKSIPDGYHTMQPYLTSDGVATAIRVLQQSFRSGRAAVHEAKGDRVGHAEIQIGDSVIMPADESPRMDAYAPSILVDRR